MADRRPYLGGLGGKRELSLIGRYYLTRPVPPGGPRGSRNGCDLPRAVMGEGTMIGARRRLPPRRRMVIPGLTRMFGDPHPRRRDRSGVDEPQTWRPGLLFWALTLLTGFAVLLFL